MPPRPPVLAVATIAAALLATTAPAKDHFLTIGGGYEPQGNQVSLERNVVFFSQVLAAQRPDQPHDIYFADGDAAYRDLQYRDPDFQCSPARRMAVELFGDPDDLDIAYRNHEVDGVRAATSPEGIRRRVRQLSRELTDGDRLVIYATAHGGSGRDDDEPFNTSVYTWNTRRFSAEELAGWLDDLPPSVPVVMVMVQCYAGGFAHTIFKEADRTQGLAEHWRAGFFAQVHDRPAAGCTPDVNEEAYQEYSSFFWAAIAGRDRTGRPVEQVDLDGDGRTSFAEAHAYAVCESDTVDIPVRTSDAVLEYYSSDGTSGESLYTSEQRGGRGRRLPAAEMIQLAGPLPRLLAQADLVDRAIVERLCDRLGLDPAGAAAQVQQALDQAERQTRRYARSSGRARSAYRRARQRVVEQVQREWPELAADLSPRLAALMAEEGETFAATVSAMPDYRELRRLDEARQKAIDQSLAAKKHEALVRRLRHTLQRIVLAANLPHVAPSDVVKRYQELLALESGNLHQVRGTPVGRGELKLGQRP